MTAWRSIIQRAYEIYFSLVYVRISLSLCLSFCHSPHICENEMNVDKENEPSWSQSNGKEQLIFVELKELIKAEKGQKS